jgi:hypothetical protein
MHKTVASQMAKLAVEQMVRDNKYGDTVPMAVWGKDHWSTFGYLETRTVDYKGTVDFRHMRGQRGVKSRYPTILAMRVELPDHSDWDCLDDIEEAGLVVNQGSAINPVIQMTEKGCLVATALRAHKAAGGHFGNFRFGA